MPHTCARTRSIPHCYHDHRRSPAAAHFLSPSNTQALWRGALKKLTQPGEAMKMSAVCATPQHNPSHTVNPTAVKQCPDQHTAAVSFHPQDNASVNLKSVLKDSRSCPSTKFWVPGSSPGQTHPEKKLYDFGGRRTIPLWCSWSKEVCFVICNPRPSEGKRKMSKKKKSEIENSFPSGSLQGHCLLQLSVLTCLLKPV